MMPSPLSNQAVNGLGEAGLRGEQAGRQAPLHGRDRFFGSSRDFYDYGRVIRKVEVCAG